LLLEEYGARFEYLPGKKNVVVDALSCLDIDELTIPQEEAFAILSELQHSNIKFPIHTALIFKEQVKVYHNPITLCKILKDMTFYVIKIKSISLSL
jgi:hypothetical protein